MNIFLKTEEDLFGRDPQEYEKVNYLCEICLEKLGEYKCGRCSTGKYCSQECQKVDWPRHKQACNKPLYEITQVKELAKKLLCDPMYHKLCHLLWLNIKELQSDEYLIITEVSPELKRIFARIDNKIFKGEVKICKSDTKNKVHTAIIIYSKSLGGFTGYNFLLNLPTTMGNNVKLNDKIVKKLLNQEMGLSLNLENRTIESCNTQVVSKSQRDAKLREAKALFEQ